MKNSYTRIDAQLVACDDCGAFADKEENIKHYDGCIPGESAKWAKYYEEAYEEEMREQEQKAG